jgi:uncharacterized protein (DUF779 family)
MEEYLNNPLTCDCSHSPFQYIPSGHVITGDLNIIQHENLRKVISHGPKFREPQYINWKHNFKIIMDVVEDYEYDGISFTTSFLLRILLMLIASIPLLANVICRNFLLLS